MNPSYLLERVISGGQTGIDQLGLEVAHALGIPTGGVAPKGYLTEDGPDERLRAYGLIENPKTDYPARTRANLIQSDGTLVFGEVVGGTKLTVDACAELNKPCLVNPTAEWIQRWLLQNRIRVLNVAGTRNSQLAKDKREEYRAVLMEGLNFFRRLSLLFHPDPHLGGLRGDPYLWADLTILADTLMLPATEEELTDLLRVLIRNLLGQDLVPGQYIFVPRYSFGGMSSGHIDADSWLKGILPLLRKRFRAMIKPKN